MTAARGNLAVPSRTAGFCSSTRRRSYEVTPKGLRIEDKVCPATVRPVSMNRATCELPPPSQLGPQRAQGRQPRQERCGPNCYRRRDECRGLVIVVLLRAGRAARWSGVTAGAAAGVAIGTASVLLAVSAAGVDRPNRLLASWPPTPSSPSVLSAWRSHSRHFRLAPSVHHWHRSRW